MLSLFMSCVKNMVRPDDLGMNISSLCFWACSSVLLVHLKGGRPGDARVVTSYTSVLFEYAGSYGYDCVPWCDWGRQQVMTALFVCRYSCIAVSALPDVRVRCRSSCKAVMTLTVPRSGHSPWYP